MATRAGALGKDPAFGFVVAENVENAVDRSRVPVPGPPLVLERGQPVEITLVNRLPEATPSTGTAWSSTATTTASTAGAAPASA